MELKEILTILILSMVIFIPFVVLFSPVVRDRINKK